MGCRIIFGLHKYDYLSDCTKDLHWLNIKQCIQYKTAVLTYKCINKTAPKYLQDLIMMQAPRLNMHSEANGKLPYYVPIPLKLEIHHSLCRHHIFEMLLLVLLEKQLL